MNLAQIAADISRVDIDLVAGRRKTDEVCDARNVVFWAARKSGMSYPQIGRHFGRRHHTTIMHGCRIAQSKMADPYFAARVDRASRAIEVHNQIAGNDMIARILIHAGNITGIPVSAIMEGKQRSEARVALIACIIVATERGSTYTAVAKALDRSLSKVGSALAKGRTLMDVDDDFAGLVCDLRDFDA